MKHVICILAALMLVSAVGLAGAQDLPKTNFKIVGYHSTVAISPRVELPFWREHIPKVSKGAITADVTPLDHMGIDEKTMLRLLRQGFCNRLRFGIHWNIHVAVNFSGCIGMSLCWHRCPIHQPIG